MRTAMPVNLKRTNERVEVSLHKNPDSFDAPRYKITTPKSGTGMSCEQKHGQIEKQPCNTDIVCPGEFFRQHCSNCGHALQYSRLQFSTISQKSCFTILSKYYITPLQ
jgi:hypothetical protein